MKVFSRMKTFQRCLSIGIILISIIFGVSARKTDAVGKAAAYLLQSLWPEIYNHLRIVKRYTQSKEIMAPKEVLVAAETAYTVKNILFKGIETPRDYVCYGVQLLNKELKKAVEIRPYFINYPVFMIYSTDGENYDYFQAISMVLNNILVYLYEL